MDNPQVGDRVTILVPGGWQRFGTVIETDYHPFGLDDAVKIRFEDEVSKRDEWWLSRWVMKAPVEKHNV